MFTIKLHEKPEREREREMRKEKGERRKEKETAARSAFSGRR
jgi:hypothetical protein